MSEVTQHMAFAASVYDLELTFVKTFTGFSNISYLVRSSPSSECPYTAACDGVLDTDDENYFVLKFCELNDVKRHEILLRGQQKMMEHMRYCGFQCPGIIRTNQGPLFSVYETPNGTKHGVHLLSYVPGCTVLERLPLADHVFVELGVWIAKLRQSLKGLEIPEVLRWCETGGDLWNMEHASGLRGHLNVIKEEPFKQLCHDILDQFEEVVLPNHQQLEKGIIHADTHDGNLILKPEDLTTCRRHGSHSNDLDPGPGQGDLSGSPVRACLALFGLIDFDDVTYSWCFIDLVICVASLMVAVETESADVPRVTDNTRMKYTKPPCSNNCFSTKRNAVGGSAASNMPYYLYVGRLILSGYQSSIPVSPLEKEVVFELICVRYVQEIVLGALSAETDSTNTEYKMWFARHGSEQLKEMWHLGKERVLAQWGVDPPFSIV